MVGIELLELFNLGLLAYSFSSESAPVLLHGSTATILNLCGNTYVAHMYYLECRLRTTAPPQAFTHTTMPSAPSPETPPQCTARSRTPVAGSGSRAWTLLWGPGGSPNPKYCYVGLGSSPSPGPPDPAAWQPQPWTPPPFST